VYRSNIVVIVFFLIFFVGCSYSPKSYVIPQEDLAVYNPKDFNTPHIISPSPHKISFETSRENENDLIIKAIFYEMRGDYKKSHYFYNLLYQKTKGKAYLLKELTTALYAGIKSPNIDKLKELVKKEPSNVQYKRILLSFYINNRKIKEAKELSKELLKISQMAIDYELSASPYILDGEYQKAIELLTKAYEKSYNEDILLKITTLYANFLNDPYEAARRLEEHRKKFGCSPKVCNQLLEIYSKTQQIEPLMQIYKDLYHKTKLEIYAIKFVEALIYKKEFDKAIFFLTHEYRNDELLYEVYLAKKDYKNALKVAQKLYKETKKPRWLAESAMALFEATPNKTDKKMLKKVVEKFEKAINSGARDSVYLNYYGYTLIDKDLDAKKGVELVKEALREEPNNSYYLDSLAWGYYKLNRCKEAYNTMKRVVEMEGLEEEEIATHWRAIQECNR